MAGHIIGTKSTFLLIISQETDAVVLHELIDPEQMHNGAICRHVLINWRGHQAFLSDLIATTCKQLQVMDAVLQYIFK